MGGQVPQRAVQGVQLAAATAAGQSQPPAARGGFTQRGEGDLRLQRLVPARQLRVDGRGVSWRERGGGRWRHLLECREVGRDIHRQDGTRVETVAFANELMPIFKSMRYNVDEILSLYSSRYVRQDTSVKLPGGLLLIQGAAVKINI